MSTEEIPFLNILALVALVLLVLVTGGIIYLTVAGWRDRRLQDEEKRTNRVRQIAKRK